MKLSDRFKFRLWSAENKRYFYDSFWLPAAGGNLVTTNCDEGYMIETSDEDVIEQCTGVKDVNGNLVYEGDIIHRIKFSFTFSGEKLTHEDKTSYVVAWDTSDTGFFAHDARYWFEPEREFTPCRIIGNIHETETENE